MAEKTTMLIVVDGFGVGEDKRKNAAANANKPFIDKLFLDYPSGSLLPFGRHVGLPDGQMGDSNVGHLNIGAGRVVKQKVVEIDSSVEDGSFFKKKAFLDVIMHVYDYRTTLHIMGIASDGCVHGSIEHLFALLDLAEREGVEELVVHCFLDGRDTPPTSGVDYIRRINERLAHMPKWAIGTISGRYYPMDRDKRWRRVKKAYDAITLGKADYYHTDPVAAVRESYARDVTDEFFVPTVITDEENMPLGTLKNGDGMIFFNFRADRARQLSMALNSTDFDGFRREAFPKIEFVAMASYDELFNFPVAFPPSELKNTLGEVISKQGLKQLRIAETEKYAHVTYFFNGGDEAVFEGEDRIMIPSPKVTTYDLKPEMSAYEVTETLLPLVRDKKYDLIILNYANPDMVGHTGVYEAALRAVEVVDECLNKLITELIKQGGQAVITSDHGNSDRMWDFEKNEVYTAHTLNPVPFLVINWQSERKFKLSEGVLADLAPTVLQMMGIKQPSEMTGQSLIEFV